MLRTAPLPRARARLTAALLLALAFSSLPAGAASAARPCTGANDEPTAATLAQARRATLCLLNRERVRRHLRMLRENARLRSAAVSYSRQMVRLSFFDHVSPTGTTLVSRILRTDYVQPTGTWALGENLAWGTGTLGTPASIVKAWMRSPGHRHNILKGRYKEIGIGITMGVPIRTQLSGATYTTEFGRRS